MNEEPRGLPWAWGVDSNFPTGAPGNFDSGEQVDWLSNRYGCHIFYGKHQGGTENTSVYPSQGSFWRSTKSFVLTTSRMPAKGLYPETSRVSKPLLGRDLLCKMEAGTPNLKQYPLRQEAQKGIQLILEKFLKTGLIKPFKSPHNTTIFLVKRPNSAEYRFVQDLRAINEVVQDLQHPVVSNPYTLLTTIPGEYGWFSVLDLKDAFFSAFLLQKNHSS